MSAADPPIEEDVIDVDELENVSGKNHRPLGDILQYYKKIKLPFEQAAKLHRHYDATCKGCGDRVSGKPQLMRKHTSKCTNTPHTGRLHALREQAKAADSNGSNQSGNQSASEEGPSKGLDRYIDRIRVTPYQMRKWGMLLAIAFVMNGWCFCSVESPEFKNFMAHVRPNFELPSKCWCLQTTIGLSLTKCCCFKCLGCGSSCISTVYFQQ
ncbi:TPA: hypothetical protein ACH3X1_014622 [Trebouxia sp. C0004]